VLAQGRERGVRVVAAPDRVDVQAERAGQLLVVGRPLGPGDDPGDPDPVPGELRRRDRARRGELMGRPGEQLVGFVEDPRGPDALREVARDGPEGGVDRTGLDRGDRRAGVEQGDVELGLIICLSVFNPLLATYRLEQVPADRIARTLSAWTVTGSATVAVLTALWGVLASLISLRVALALAGLLLMATPLLLPRHGNLTAWPNNRDDRIKART
jgi:hypothetical protein